MTGALLLGTGFGGGLALLVAWFIPAHISLKQAFTLLHPSVPSANPVSVLPAQPTGWAAIIGRPAIPALRALGLPRQTVTKDLAICGRDAARHVAEQATMAMVGFLSIPALAGILAAGGVWMGWQTPVWAALIGAGIGMIIPDVALASEATTRRRQLREATAGMLDLVVISLAGGSGIDQALREATDEATNWAHQALRHAVEAAHLTRRPMWQTIGDLGEITGVSTLMELSSALSLAGSEGARIKTTLSARSSSLSAHQIAEAEAAAVSATERMVLPVVGLLGGFLIFLGYPAFAAVIQAL